MNFIPLPTDNLYKFTALSGLAILLFSLAYPIRLVVDLELKAAQTSGHIEATTHELKKVDRLLAELESSKVPTREELNVLHEKRDVAQMSHYQDLSAKNELLVLRAELNAIRSVARIGVWLGSLMSVIGFYLWYFRVQRPADRIASRQAQEDVT